jgi:predicted nucleic acid-binding protein
LRSRRKTTSITSRHKPTGVTIVTTIFILNETVTFFNRRSHHAKAVEIGEYLLASPSVELYAIDDELFQDDWAFFQRYDDKRFSL